ncbi:MAG TPA: WXG100 family type VII secretion target [Pseudonocardiaceae bacterium]|nr:WXG100 family type VII secretion target [Pseudonocardiaceae bacterium]
MSADQISVQFSALQQSAQQLQTTAKNLTDQLDQLSSNLNPIRQTWYASNSSAGEAAQQAETRLRAAAADIVNIINQFGGKVSDAHDLQYALEQKNTSFFAT